MLKEKNSIAWNQQHVCFYHWSEVVATHSNKSNIVKFKRKCAADDGAGACAAVGSFHVVVSSC